MRAPPRAGDSALREALQAALVGLGIEAGVTSVRREENAYESSHRTELVGCTLDDGSQLALLCKCGVSDVRKRLGLRRGLSYEASVYRHVLSGEDPVPRFYGSYDDSSGLTFVFLEYLGEGWQLDLGPETAIVDAAAAIAELHRGVVERGAPSGLAFLNRYDRRYFRTCLQQARAAASRWRERVPAFDGFVNRFEHELELLLAAPQTLVHGEFTPHNVVWAHERPHAVDWEEAAIGAGEIDIACLTDEWDEDLLQLAVAAYRRTRWHQGPPHDFEATLEAARMYWLLRWLGDPDEPGADEDVEWITGRINELTAGWTPKVGG
jgi:hypothetical protein